MAAAGEVKIVFTADAGQIIEACEEAAVRLGGLQPMVGEYARALYQARAERDALRDQVIATIAERELFRNRGTAQRGGRTLRVWFSEVRQKWCSAYADSPTYTTEHHTQAEAFAIAIRRCSRTASDPARLRPDAVHFEFVEAPTVVLVRP